MMDNDTRRVKQRIIILVGGPMGGMAHELQSGWPVPDKAGLVHPDDEAEVGKQDLHWYVIREGKGYFERTEARDGRPGGL